MKFQEYAAHWEKRLFKRSGICAWLEIQASSRVPDVAAWKNLIRVEGCDGALHGLWLGARTHLGTYGDPFGWNGDVEDPDLRAVLWIVRAGQKEIVWVTDGTRSYHAVFASPHSGDFFLIPSDDVDLRPDPDGDAAITFIPLRNGSVPKDESLLRVVPVMLLRAWENGNLNARDALVRSYAPCVRNAIQCLRQEFESATIVRFDHADLAYVPEKCDAVLVWQRTQSSDVSIGRYPGSAFNPESFHQIAVETQTWHCHDMEGFVRATDRDPPCVLLVRNELRKRQDSACVVLLDGAKALIVHHDAVAKFLDIQPSVVC